MKNIKTPVREQMSKSAELLGQIDDLMRDAPALGAMLLADLIVRYGHAAENGAAPKKRLGRPKEPTDKIENVAAKALAGGAWVSTPELEKKTGIDRYKLKMAMRADKAKFEERTDPDNERRYQWRLKETN